MKNKTTTTTFMLYTFCAFCILWAIYILLFKA